MRPSPGSIDKATSPIPAYPAKDVIHAAEMGAPIFHRREERDLYSQEKLNPYSRTVSISRIEIFD
jgi:hypothetical protein